MIHTATVIALVVGNLLWSSSPEMRRVPSRLFKPEGHGAATTYLFPDDEVRRITAVGDVVTPHVVWAKPLRGGAVRVLAIAHKSQGRWPVELAQRFDLCVKTVYGHGPDRLGAPRSGMTEGMIAQDHADVVARLLQAMNEPIDVVVSDITPEALGAEAKARLAALLSRGVGYVGPTKGMDLTGYAPADQAQREMIGSAVPIAGLRLLHKQFGSADQAAGKLLRLWSRDKGGRVADLSGYPRDDAPPDPNRLELLDQVSMEQEAWCSLLGRASLWAARRVFAKSGADVRWPEGPVDRASMPLRLKPCRPGEDALAVDVWDADGRRRHCGSDLTIPPLSAGRYFVGVRLLSGQRVADWSFGSIVVRASVGISSIELDSEKKRPGQKVRAEVALSSDPPKGSKLCFEVIDNYGRSVFEDVRAASKEVVFEGDFAESLHVYNYANVKLLGRDGDLVAEDRRAFYVARPGPPRDDLTWMVWEGGAGFAPRRRVLLKQFARLGAKGILAAGEPVVRSVAMVNAHPVVYAFRLRGVTPDKEGLGSPCLTSPGYRSSTIKSIQKAAADNGAFSPLLFYLGDDVRYLGSGSDACWRPSCRAFLAAWAEKQYGDVDALNRAWGSAYRGFEQVEPIRQADALAAVAKDQFAPLCHWLDHQLCNDAKVAGFWRDMGRAIREVAPGTPSNMGSAVVGWTWPGSGFDFWQLAEGKDLVFQYPNPWVHDIFRCAARRDALHGTWYGGYGLYTYKPSYDPDWMPWWSIFRGVNLHAMYYGGQGTAWYSERLCGADLGPMPVFERILANFAELKGGIAKLLFNAARENDGVAMAYSPASLHASVVFGKGLAKAAEWKGQTTGADQFIYMQCWEGMSTLVRDMGFSFDVVPSAHLGDGRFSEGKYRVLILPLQLRVTAGEAAAIRRFVRGGGILIADALTGIFDGHCRVKHSGVLADVLGVAFDPGLPGPGIALREIVTAEGQPLGRVAADAGLKLTGAEAQAKSRDGVPVLTWHTYGKGGALLLNVLSRDYQIWRTLAAEMPFRDAVAKILSDKAGLRPTIRCDVAARGEPAPHRIQATEFHRYRLGKAGYVGVLRNPKLRPDDAVYLADLRPKMVWMTFDRKAHVYDVRRGMYRGLTDKIEDVIYANRAELFALLPYEVRDVKVSARQRGAAVSVTAEIVPGDDGARPTTHVFHVSLVDPTGRRRDELTRNVVAGDGRLAEKVFLGYNAQPGTWRVTVRDVASGMERTVDLALVAPSQRAESSQREGR